MREQDKPFILYRGLGTFRIVPRNAQGWRLTIGWIATLIPVVGLFIAFLSREPQGAAFFAGLAVYLLAMACRSIGGAIWMKSRAEVVDLEELLRIKRERDRGHR